MTILTYCEGYEGEPHAVTDIMYGGRQKLYSRDRNYRKKERDLEIVTGDLSFSIWKSEFVYACVFWHNDELVLRYAFLDPNTILGKIDIGVPKFICSRSNINKMSDTYAYIGIRGNVIDIVDNGTDIDVTTGFSDEADYMEWQLKQ